MSLIQEGLQKGYIILDSDSKVINYVYCNKKYRFTDPEEQVRAEIYLQLIINYKYEPKKIDLEVRVPHRTPNNLADIVIYNDDKLTDPYIVVECKKQDTSNAEFIQAIEQGFGNANSLGASFLLVTSGLKSNYYDVKSFKPMERDINKIADIPVFGSNKLAKAKYTKGGVDGFELEIVTEQELTRIFKQAHDALWAGGKRNPSEAFDELDKLVFCKIWDERKKRAKGEAYNFQVFTGEDSNKLLNRIKRIYDEGKEKDSEVFKEGIKLEAKELETIVGYLSKVNLHKTDLDSKGRAFETFMDSFFRGEFGQYFTPRNIVKFIVDSLPIDNESKVLDTSCGSGGFLLYALDKVRKLADEKADIYDMNEIEHYNFWHDFASNNLFGIEISEMIARTAKMNMIIHDDGHTNVISFDGLDDIDKIRESTKNQGYKKDSFDYIITNPPFGATIKYSEKRYVESYELGLKNINWIDAKIKNINLNDERARDRQNSEILFIEQCHRFLKPGGILAMVIPDGLLTNSTMQYVRDWIEEKYRIISVISLPQIAFSANGAGVKSSVIFLKKYDNSTTEGIRTFKNQIQDEIFERAEFGARILQLEEERKSIILRGDQTIQVIDEQLVNHIEALKNQGTFNLKDQRELIKAAKQTKKLHEQTDEYKEWLKRVNDEYNENIQNIKENMEDQYLSNIKEKLRNDKIFMAVVEEIGYDAVGREVGVNELEIIASELSRFISSIEAGNDSSFTFALI